MNIADKIYLFSNPAMYEKTNMGSVYINALDNYKLYIGNKIISNHSVESFHIHNNKIYYLNDKGNAIYKVNLDGSGITKIYSARYEDQRIDSFFVSDSGLYIFTIYKVYTESIKYIIKYNWEMKMVKNYNLDTHVFSLGKPSFYGAPFKNKFVVVDDMIFIIGEFGGDKHLLTVDTKNEITELGTVSTLYPKVFDGYIFFTKNEHNNAERSVLYKVNVKDTSNVKYFKSRSGYIKICDVDETWYNVDFTLYHLNLQYCSAYNVNNGWIYYSDANNKGRLSRIDINGLNKKVLANETIVKSIKVIGDWVYYRGYNGEQKPLRNGFQEYDYYDKNKGIKVGCRIKVDGNKEYLEYIAFDVNRRGEQIDNSFSL